ncbi:DUF4390 domain-containing protein [Ignatzschineria rhizosphaerae]|uniref:DUF4390 domain-containing protein n=1 Tax=Ignatzschineria rhizosphaerae TaxID=2923279 RepID=A0ABY3X178_9GAMM|nr:DUF4390 domain-containing protein [Ignatzschineria rhizosphaerae]UNM96611.1 DUF4390 domain-containing protein [Ignatzschineria rhizosphaerae]
MRLDRFVKRDRRWGSGLLTASQNLLSFFYSDFIKRSHLLLLIMISGLLLPLQWSEAAPKQSSLEVQSVRSDFYQAGSAMARIRDTDQLLNGTLTKVDMLLSIKSDIVMSEEQTQMLLNGIPLTFVYDIRIQEKGFWSFWNGNNYAKEIRYLLFYHGLSKQFVVRDIETKKQHSYPTLSLALFSISTPSNIEFKLMDEDGFKIGDYQGEAKLWLDIEALPTPLRIPAYLSKNWWLNSSWYKWELKI